MMILKCSEESSEGEENFIWFKMLEYRKKAPRELYDQTEGSSASARLQAKTQAYNHTWNSPLSDQCTDAVYDYELHISEFCLQNMKIFWMWVILWCPGQAEKFAGNPV